MDDQLSRPGTDRRAKGALASSSVVYFCRPVGATSETWERVTSHEGLAAIQADSSQYELLTLFAVPVDDVARAPVSTVAAARVALDLIERRTANIERRVNDRRPDQTIHFEGELGVLAMRAGANELQSAVERAQGSSLKFIHVRTDEAAQVIGYIKYLADLAGKAQASKCCAQVAAPQAGAGKVEVPELIAEIRAMPIEVPGDLKQGMEQIIYEHGHRDAVSAAVAILSAHGAASPAAPVAEKEQPTYWKAQRKIIERAIIGLRDGWAARKDADDALMILAQQAEAAPAASAPTIGQITDALDEHWLSGGILERIAFLIAERERLLDAVNASKAAPVASAEPMPPLLDYRTCCDHPDCTTCAGRGGFYRPASPVSADADSLTAADYEEVLAGHRRLVRKLDVLLNGDAGAAKQASLGDIVAQVQREGIRSANPIIHVAPAPADGLLVDAGTLADDLRRWHKTEVWDWDHLLTAASMIDKLVSRAAPVIAQAAPAPADEAVAEFGRDSIFIIQNQPNGERWPEGTKLYTRAAPAQADWHEAARIADLPTVDEALQGFSDDPTAENGICVVRAVLESLTTPVPEAAAPDAKLRADIEVIADELEADAANYEGDFADTVNGCAAALRHLAAPAPEAATPVALMTCPDCGTDRLKAPCPRMADECAMVADAHLLAAPVASQPAQSEQQPLYTCKGKGGEYALIGVAYGAGTSRGNTVNLYRETATGVTYYRTPTDFHDRMEQIKGRASQPAGGEEASDPMNWPLPCDVKVGAVNIKKGCKLRTLVTRMESLHRMAVAALPKVTDEDRAEFFAMFPHMKPDAPTPSTQQESDK